MNELQISLLVIGFLVIAGVYGFNRLQEKKHRRLVEKAFPSSHEDVLLRDQEPDGLDAVKPERNWEDPLVPEYEPDSLPEMPETARFRNDPRIEPVISGTPGVAEERMEESFGPDFASEPEAAEADAEIEAEVGAGIGAPPVASVNERPAAPLDEVIDYVVQLHLGEPIGAAALMDAIQHKNVAGKQVGKPVRWLGMNPQSGCWDVLVPGNVAEYLHVAATLQLASRSGPILEQDLMVFCDQVQAVADEIAAIAEFPERLSALTRAAELDNFGVDVDVLIGVNVITQGGEAFASTKIRALAESAGMKLMPDGAFHYIDEDGADLFSLSNFDPTPFSADNIRHLSTHGITFLFDVPKVADGVRIFNQMLLMAKKMAPSLGGQLVDDNRRPLNDAAIAKIKQQLADIYARMEKQQIVSGSHRALRLFS